MAFYKAKIYGRYEIQKLLTIVRQDTRQMPMYEVRKELLERRAEKLGIPLAILDFSHTTDSLTTERNWTACIVLLSNKG